MQQLYYADLAYNKIDGEGARLISQCRCNTLAILDLSGNDMGSDCAALCTSTELVNR